MKTKDFEDKVLPLTDRIYPMVNRMLGNPASAEDVVQEIMIKLWDQRYKIGQHPNLKGYVFLTSRNYCLDLLKKKKPLIDSLDFQLDVLASKSNASGVEWSELNEIIKDIMKVLPSQQCEVIMMRDFDGFEFEEIAAAMDLKVEHVRVLLSRARKKVSTKLKKIYGYG